MYDFGTVIKKLEYVQKTCKNHMASDDDKLVAHEIMRQVGQELVEIGERGFKQVLEVMTRNTIKEAIRLRGNDFM